ncbi:MAG: hypothetical protein JNL38_28180 [Myxococcales bacterium]|nr:hypothetical protein [Myxococcales bacterium]
MRGAWQAALVGLALASAAGRLAVACSPFGSTDAPSSGDASAEAAAGDAGAADAASGCGAGGPFSCDGATACLDFEDIPPTPLADGLQGPFADITNSRSTSTLLEIADGGVGCGRGLHAVVTGDGGGEKRGELDVPASPPPQQVTVEARVRVVSAATDCRILDVEYELPDAGNGRIFAVATGAAGIRLDSDGFGFDGSGQVPATGAYQRLVLVVPFGKTPTMQVDDGPLLTATPIGPVRAGSSRIKVFLGPETKRAPCEMWIDRVIVR